MKVKGMASEDMDEKLLIEGLSEPSELPRRRPNRATRSLLGRDHARHAWRFASSFGDSADHRERFPKLVADLDEKGSPRQA